MEKDKLDIKWDEKAVQNFENYLKLMYGEHGKVVVKPKKN